MGSQFAGASVSYPNRSFNISKPVEQYDMLRGLREFLQWRQGDAIILAEANVLPETDMNYFGRAGDRMHMMFNFQVNQNLFYALAAADDREMEHIEARINLRANEGLVISRVALRWTYGRSPVDQLGPPAPSQ